MANPKSVSVIFDTNVWISFLIGKRLSVLKTLLASGAVRVVLSEQLLDELRLVTQRPHFKKYFPKEKVDELTRLLQVIGKVYALNKKHTDCRDPKDNFLLDLIEKSKADYLVTGDKDLLALHPFLTARIVRPSDFERELEKFI